MRDKNLTYSQFNIQLEKNLRNLENKFNKFFRRAVVDSPTFLSDENKISYPKDFRLLRALTIVHWFLPEESRWRIFLDLTEMTLSHLNRKQRIEIQLLLSSKENCVRYLYATERYSSFEIFGNILGNDLRDLDNRMKIHSVKYILVQAQRKRGYDDHGSRKPNCKWLPTSDYSFDEYQNEKERKQNLELKLIARLSKIIENLLLD